MATIVVLECLLHLADDGSFDVQEFGEVVRLVLVSDRLWGVAQARKLDLLDGLVHVSRTLKTVPIHFQNLVLARVPILIMILRYFFNIAQSKNTNLLLILDVLPLT